MRNSIQNRNRVLRAQGATALVAFTLMLGMAGRMLQPRPANADPGLSAGDHAIENANRREMPRPAQGPSILRPRGPSGDGGRSGSLAVKDAGQMQAFRGTVVREGSDYLLRDLTGAKYRLDASGSAQAYEGRPVKVSGQLEESARLIHVQEIEFPPRDVVGPVPTR